METVEKCPGQQRPCCSDSPALSFLGSPWAGVVSEDQSDGGGYAEGVDHGHGGHGGGEDHGDGVGHCLVLLLLDGDNRPGVGHDGEDAHRQGEEKERWVEYLTRRNITNNE